jgi:Beta-lactamase enzyme family
MRAPITRAALVGAAALAILAAPAQADVSEREAKRWHPRLGAAREYAEKRAGHVGFAVFDMRGRLAHHHGGGRALMASTFKVMLMVAYLRRPSVEDRELTSSEKGLIKPMIRRSDNDAATTIRDILGREPIERLAAKARMKHFVWNDIWGYCKTSARDQAFFMRTLRRYVPERHWHFARRQLERIIPRQRWGVGQVNLPSGWHLHFKGGWGSGSGAVDHQVVLLRNKRRRVGLAVLTESNPSHSYAQGTLEGVFRRLLRRLPS